MDSFIFDTHAHYDDERFGNSESLDKLFSDLERNGVKGILTCGTNYESCEYAIKLAEKYDIVYSAIGIYPHDIINVGEFDYERLKSLLTNPKVVAMGEIGLDYYYDDTPRETQLEWIDRLLPLANELDLPISFHDRDAHEDTMKMLKKYRPKGIVHCFSGSVEMAREIVSLGMYLGIGGVITFKNAKKLVDVVREIPLEHLVLETDAPYMSPEPVRGTVNRSDYIHYIAEKVAEIKGISADEVLSVTYNNALKCFGIN